MATSLTSFLRRALLCLVACAPCAATVAQPCEGIWSDAFAWGGISGRGVEVEAMIVFDDGSGPALFVATTGPAGFGGAVGTIVGRFDGHTWSAADEGLISSLYNYEVKDFEIYDDGSGPALYAIAETLRRWNGESWDVVAGTSLRGEMQVFDDGTGLALYGGGWKWDGKSLLNTYAPGGPIAAADTGTANTLYCAYQDTLYRLESGVFKRLDISRFLSLISGTINTLTSHDDGTGVMLYAGGRFELDDYPNVTNVAKFDGTEWLRVGSGLPEEVFAFEQSPIDGSLIATGGDYDGPGFIAKWDGNTWQMIEENMKGGGVLAATVGDFGQGNHLYLGGSFENDNLAIGPPLSYLAMWDGRDILQVGNGLDGYESLFHWPAMSFETFDDGSGEALYIGGSAQWAGQNRVNGVARWDGKEWTNVGRSHEDIAFVRALEVVQDTTGHSALFAASRRWPFGGGSSIDVIERWDGTTWGTMAEANATIHTLEFIPTGPFAGLYAGGDFTEIGGVTASRLARLDIATGTWHALDTGFDKGVADIALLDAGNELALFVAGYFTAVTGGPASGLARLSTTQEWQGIQIPNASTTGIKSMEVYDIGSGPQLFVSGYISGVWDGTRIIELATATGMRGVAGFDDGHGPAVYFARPGQTVRWNGKSFEYLPMTPDSQPGRGDMTLERIELNGQTSLFFGGPITHVAPYPYALTEKRISSGYIAQYLGCGGSCYADCDKSTGVGTLDIFDFLCFQSAFVATDPYACLCDMSTGPRTCDIFDFLCFQNAFVAGCP